MADITCARCGEPWDADEVFHGFEEDERNLFLEGSACPHCVDKFITAHSAPHARDWAESLLEATDDPDTLLEGILDRLNES